jgi:hypothetical protein
MSARVQRVLTSQTEPAISELVELDFFAALLLRIRLGNLERADAERAASLFRRISRAASTGASISTPGIT